MMPTEPRRPEQLLADIDAEVDQYVQLILNADPPKTTPEVMVMALNASDRRADVLAIYLATALQKLAIAHTLRAAVS